MSETQILEWDAEKALLGGKVQGLVAHCYENERPLQGLAGLLDWRFEGLLTRGIRAGYITGQPGECVYLPVSRMGRTFHLLVVGGGVCPAPGKRTIPPALSLDALRRNLVSLRIKDFAFSRAELGLTRAAAIPGSAGAADIEASFAEARTFLAKQMKGIPLWVVP